MTDSYDSSSFRDGWLAIGLSRDVALNFQCALEELIIPLRVLYYFKALSTFDVPGLSDEEKFEEIDDLIVSELTCDHDEILTISTSQGPVIVMPEDALLRAGVKLPKWPERNSRPLNRKRRLAVLAS